MAGKRSAAYKGKHYRNYACSRAMKSRALCAFYNGHSTTNVELQYWILAYVRFPNIISLWVDVGKSVTIYYRATV